MGIEIYSTTAANNSASPPSGWPEGMAPSAVNDCGRQMMADIRSWYETAEWINFGYTHSYSSGSVFSIGGGVDRTSTYHVGRRIKAVGAGTGTIYGSITGSSYSAPTNTVTVSWDSGSLQNEALTVFLHIVSSVNAPAVQAKSGTKLLFPGISAAPTGWTIDATSDHAALRVRATASTATGGSLDFATAFDAGRSSDSYTLVVSDIPSHTHTGPSHAHDMGNHTHGISPAAMQISTVGPGDVGSAFKAGTAGAAATQGPSTNTTGASGTGATGAAGGGGAHAHGLPSFAVKYVDACICVKI